MRSQCSRPTSLILWLLPLTPGVNLPGFAPQPCEIKLWNCMDVYSFETGVHIFGSFTSWLQTADGGRKPEKMSKQHASQFTKILEVIDPNKHDDFNTDKVCNSANPTWVGFVHMYEHCYLVTRDAFLTWCKLCGKTCLNCLVDAIGETRIDREIRSELKWTALKRVSVFSCFVAGVLNVIWKATCMFAIRKRE